MNKEVLIALISKDIKELEMLTMGFPTMDYFPAPYMELAIQKAVNLVENMKQLQQCNDKKEGTKSDDYNEANIVNKQPIPETDTKPQHPHVVINPSVLEKKRSIEINEIKKCDEINKTNEINTQHTTQERNSAADNITNKNTEDEHVHDEQTFVSDETNILSAEASNIQNETECKALEEVKAEETIDNTKIISEESQEEEKNTDISEEQSSAETDFDNSTNQTTDSEQKNEKRISFFDFKKHKEHVSEQKSASTLDKSSNTILGESIKTSESLHDALSKEDTSIASSMAKKKISDLKSSLTIADRFRFQRELFNGDGEKMMQTINDLNNMNSLRDAVEYIDKRFKWEKGSPCVESFMQLLERRYL